LLTVPSQLPVPVTITAEVVFVHPVEVSVNVNVTEPADKLVTVPSSVTLATPGLLLIQVPPVMGERVVVLPAQIAVLPVIFTTGSGRTVTVTSFDTMGKPHAGVEVHTTYQVPFPKLAPVGVYVDAVAPEIIVMAPPEVTRFPHWRVMAPPPDSETVNWVPVTEAHIVWELAGATDTDERSAFTFTVTSFDVVAEPQLGVEVQTINFVPVPKSVPEGRYVLDVAPEIGVIIPPVEVR
jgi:hypothetical protein